MNIKYMISFFSFSWLLILLNSCGNSSPKPIADKVLAKDTNKNKPAVFAYDSNKKYIYLTFDDGPQGGTSQCMQVCKSNNAKATFFMVGQHASSPHLKGIVTAVKNSYPLFLLANHSQSHADKVGYRKYYAMDKYAYEDIMKAQQTLGVPQKIVRLPGNTSWVYKNKFKANAQTTPTCKLLDSAGFNILGWDVEWNFNHKSADPIESPERLMNIVNNMFAKNKTLQKNHLVILTHDRMFRKPNFADSLNKFIQLAKQNSAYVFETMDHYPNLK